MFSVPECVYFGLQDTSSYTVEHPSFTPNYCKVFAQWERINWFASRTGHRTSLFKKYLAYTTCKYIWCPFVKSWVFYFHDGNCRGLSAPRANAVTHILERVFRKVILQSLRDADICWRTCLALQVSHHLSVRGRQNAHYKMLWSPEAAWYSSRISVKQNSSRMLLDWSLAKSVLYPQS